MELHQQIQTILLTTHQAAHYLNLRVSRIRYAVFKKQLPYIKIGRLVRFEKSALDTWVKEQSK